MDDIYSERLLFIGRGEEGIWKNKLAKADSALNDSNTNLSAELKMNNVFKKKLANGDYSMSGPSGTVTKRSFVDSSMSNDDSSTRTNKRTFENS